MMQNKNFKDVIIFATIPCILYFLGSAEVLKKSINRRCTSKPSKKLLSLIILFCYFWVTFVTYSQGCKNFKKMSDSEKVRVGYLSAR
jgi:hypothetical protein